MKILKLFFAISVLSSCFSTANAQSLSYAKSLIEQGKYLEAAKQLRPLADGGNAEAQYLAATLFFVGLGVSRSEEQGLKYATMSAEQGNGKAALLIGNYYRNKGNIFKAVSVMNDYIVKEPMSEKEKISILQNDCRDSLYNLAYPLLVVTAPKSVCINDEFKVEYIFPFNQKHEFIGPALNPNFEVKSFSDKGRSYSYYKKDGKIKVQESQLYSYCLVAKQEGKHTVGPAFVSENGKYIKSDSFDIRVYPTTSYSINTSVNNKQLYLKDTLLLTYEILQSNIEDKIISLTCTMNLPEELREVKMIEKKQILENKDEQNPKMSISQQHVIIPIKTGTIKIPSKEFTIVTRKEVYITDPFEAFFNEKKTTCEEIPRTIKAPAMEIYVNSD